MEVIQKCGCGGFINYQFDVISGLTDKICGHCSKLYAKLTDEDIYIEQMKKGLEDDNSRIYIKAYINDDPVDR